MSEIDGYRVTARVTGANLERLEQESGKLLSYARWSATSSVYVYAHLGGYIDCCACTTLHSIAETVEHMQWHRDQGDTVPDRLLDPATYDERDFQQASTI